MIPKWLESPFILWLLSAVFISFGSWAYTLWDAEHKEEAALLTRIERLDDEIQYRFARAGLFVKFRVLDPRQDAAPLTKEHKALVGDFIGAVMRAPQKDATLFPEYAERGMGSLMKEIELALVKVAETAPNAKVLQRSSVACVSQAIALLAPLDEIDKPELYAIQVVRGRALIASAYRWGFRGPLPWSSAMRQNQVTKNDFGAIVAVAREQTAASECLSPTMVALKRDAMTLQDVGQVIP